MTEQVSTEIFISTGRVEAFSDGVFAIAITLLAIDLKVPHDIGLQSLATVLSERWPVFLAFLNSFTTILVIWINHHNLFTHIHRISHLLLLANGLLLLCVSFLPFSTSLVAEHFGHAGQSTAAVVYTGTFLMLAFAFNLLWRYACRGKRLLKPNVTDEQVRIINCQYLVGPVFYGLAFVHVTTSLLLTMVLSIFYAITASRSVC
ncbi:MAG: DUF1211 domain-containing protein [candidate division Zixibacteria bacterium]|nr:DUF1211 domain-containing protein [candidate division Zixibacteria bacterium]